MNITFTPWVEKYRPTNFNDIVLDDINKNVLKNIIEKQYFPNLLFYGPPGTGKTTSIINLIKSYQSKSMNDVNYTNSNSIIHLNASDERGIDIIRNQINSFVNSKNLFNNGMKFVILDEVDYMTKNAQIALRYLLQNYKSNVRFCLICNYISRIDEALQNEFVKLRFNQLPEEKIISFLKNINKQEKLNFTMDTLKSVQELFNSDIRSMINYMQSNEKIIQNKKIIKNEIWEEISSNIINNDIDICNIYINNISNEYNIEKKNIIKNYLNYIIRYKKQYVCGDFLSFSEYIMHINEINIDLLTTYFLLKMKIFIKN